MYYNGSLMGTVTPPVMKYLNFFMPMILENRMSVTPDLFKPINLKVVKLKYSTYSFFRHITSNEYFLKKQSVNLVYFQKI